MQPVRGSHRSPEGVHPDYSAADGDLELGAGGVEGGGLYWEFGWLSYHADCSGYTCADCGKRDERDVLGKRVVRAGVAGVEMEGRVS